MKRADGFAQLTIILFVIVHYISVSLYFQQLCLFYQS